MNAQVTILVTGGLGFIGSHTCIALQRAGYRLVVIDNLANSKIAVLERIRELGAGSVEFHRADTRDEASLRTIFESGPIEAVIHFAGLKAVGESVEKPLQYYENNISGTIVLLRVMQEFRVRRIVFSSSATVYGEPQRLPLAEDHPLCPVNPYSRSKQFIERIISDVSASSPQFRHAILRYFNPIGAHPSGRIGEDPRGIPNNLFPFVTQVAIKRLAKLRVFGNDYNTIDGTGVRDYIHVMDLAAGHVSALLYLLDKDRSITVNLGTGRGYSVLEVVGAFERTTGASVPREFAARRAGDVASYYADVTLASSELGWRTKYGIEDMCRDAWAWQSANPQGYPD
jgi:UDP-glucose 4-epimerase